MHASSALEQYARGSMAPAMALSCLERPSVSTSNDADMDDTCTPRTAGLRHGFYIPCDKFCLYLGFVSIEFSVRTAT